MASVGSDGMFLVDSMYGQMHQKIMDALAKIGPQPIRYLVNTHLHGDHTGGNEAMARLGAVIVSHENMRQRMAASRGGGPAGALPLVTYRDRITLHFNGEEIEIFHPEPAHTDGDSIIYFRHANVMHVGDVPASLRYPNIGVDDGGSVDGMMAAGRQVMTITPERRYQKSFRVISGPIVGFKEKSSNSLKCLPRCASRSRTPSAPGKRWNRSLASKPTADFDQGRMGGAITPDRFVTLRSTPICRGA